MGSARKKVKILLVDDKASNLLALSVVLETLQEETVQVQSGRAALECLDREEFGLILLDIMMPEFSGLQTLEKIREHATARRTPVILLTAAGDSRTFLNQGYSLGAVDFLSKPVSAEILRAKVSVFVDLYSSRQRIEEQAKTIREMERKTYDQQLQKESFLSRMILESVAEYALFMVDREGLVVTWNTGAERILGFSSDAIIGKSIALFFPSDKEGALPNEQIAEAETLGASRSERWLIRSDQTRFWANLSVTRVGEPPQIFGYSVVLRDNTDRKEAEDKLKLRARELSRSNADLQRFAYVASHDLKEPLRMVSNYVQLLKRRYGDKLDGDADVFIGFAVEGVKRMYALINDLLAYSSVGRDGKTDSVDCNELLEEAKANLQLMLQECGGTIECGPLPRIKGMRVNLVQLFQNLLGNALKFRTDVSPQIRIQARQLDQHWLFSVSDNGIGIDPQFSDKIFEIFQRLHTKDSYPGSGIGLAVCKKIVEQHGGRIWFESNPGDGATFYFTLKEETQNTELPPQFFNYEPQVPSLH